MKKKTFDSVLSDAIRDLMENGFSLARFRYWQALLDLMVESEYASVDAKEKIKASLTEIFKKRVTPTALTKFHPGLDRTSIARIVPRLRPELERRIITSADLIKLNREQAIAQTMKRFSGWMSSVPEGGTDALSLRKVKEQIIKPLRSLSFEERRLHIDQGHKMIANVNAILAEQSNAIVVIWRSHYRQAGYDYREDHKERDGKVYALKGNWAIEAGFMNKGDGYIEDTEMFGEAINCQCFGTYYRSLRDLPAGMLTRKGREELERVKVS